MIKFPLKYRYQHIPTGEIFYSCVKLKNLKDFIVPLNETDNLRPNDTLIIRRALGDILMLFPALELWCSKKGNTTVDFATDSWLMDFVSKQWFVNKVYNFQTVDESTYRHVLHLEKVVDFISVDKRKHRSILFADLLFYYTQDTLGIKYDPKELKIGEYFDIVAENDIEAMIKLKENGWGNSKSLVVIAPITKSKFRNWSGEDKLIELLPEIDFVLLHDKKIQLERDYPNLINLSGKTSLMVAASICNLADAAVVPDSGMMHVCGVLKVKTLAIFGKVIPFENRITFYPTVEPIESTCSFTDYCYDSQFKSCANTPEYRSCMNKIKPEYVAERLKEILE